MVEMFDLTGKTAFITGGGRGIGRAIALALASAGANVAITSRTESELISTAKEIEGLSRKAYFKSVDVRNQKDIQQFVDEVVNEEGKIDILVNGAGMNIRNSFLDITEAEWDLIMDVNLKSILFTSQAVIPHMKKQKYGKIINIASLTSEVAFPEVGVYAASKGGVSQLTKVMAVEFADDGILTNAIGPGYIKTELTKALIEDDEKMEWITSRTPLRRTGRTDELQGAVIYLASDASSYVTGQTLYIDGGWLSSS